ncbi:MAG: glucose-6-phosphate dehydrogenase [Dyella sp.]
MTASRTDSAPSSNERPADPCVMVIFGAAGDLTKRLVVPALYNLRRNGLLPERFALIGVNHGAMSDTAWKRDLRASLQNFVQTRGGEQGHLDETAWDWLSKRMSYLAGDFGDDKSYAALTTRLREVGTRYQTDGNALFYLATPERFFGDVIERLGAAGLVSEHVDGAGWRRVVIEKPFGHDVASARALNQRIGKVLDESQTYRIDHFLGKETVQNIMAFRFANGLFEPIWHRDRIDHVQITAAETVGVELRGSFYEQTGCLRDMVPNHLFQLLAMVAMEPPASFDAEAVRTRKAEVIQAIRPINPEDAVRGQYGPGAVNGNLALAYRDEPQVAPESSTETFVAMKLAIDTWRWAGVPFYLRTGKHMGRRTTEIAIRFKSAPFAPFRSTGIDAFGPDWLVLQIQPDEGISLQFDVKKPGPKVALAPVRMDFKYADWFPSEPAVGYETLLYDCMSGDATLFQRADMVEACWRAVQPILDEWARRKPNDFPNYASGSAGPASAETLLAIGGRAWRPLSHQEQPYGARSRAKRTADGAKTKAGSKPAVGGKKSSISEKTATAKQAPVSSKLAKSSPGAPATSASKSTVKLANKAPAAATPSKKRASVNSALSKSVIASKPSPGKTRGKRAPAKRT